MPTAHSNLRIVTRQIRSELKPLLQEQKSFIEKCRVRPDQMTFINLVDEPNITWQQVERESTAEEDRQNRAHGVRRLWGPSDAFAVVMDAIAVAGENAPSQSQLPGECLAGECLARVADHFVDVWSANLEKPRGTRARREVFGRHNGLCGVPGCSAEAQHEHHIVYRSQGGGNETENLVALCAAHHLRGVHGGYVTVQGRAGENLVWRFGGETWRTTGMDDVRGEADFAGPLERAG